MPALTCGTYADSATPAGGFNPILVQFKRAPGSFFGAGTEVFQSYLSPIQTLRPDCERVDDVVFQSYLSPIQTETERRDIPVELGVSILS